jgi:peptide/nickel transport system substrate-binding protein/microcin C transport system substrate-binding protein
MKLPPRALVPALLLTLAACTQGGGSGGSGGNTFYQAIDADPTTLNPITSSDAYASEIQSSVFDSLLTRNEDTWEWQPALAEGWEVSKDGKTFTFKLREGLKWTDGQPLTAEDVKYSFDVYFEKDRFQAPHMMAYLEGIESVAAPDPRTVVFKTRERYFKNFDVVAGLAVIPKHFYAQGDAKDPKFNRELIGSGPYVLGEWAKGQRIVLKRNPDYWGLKVPYFAERAKFDRLYYRLAKEETVRLEMFKRGDLDFLMLTPEQYVTKTDGPDWGKRLIKVKGENSSPENFAYGFLAWNELNPLFKDRDVRTAMSHLINRDFMIEKFRYGMSEKATGPFGNRSPNSSPRVKPVEYDPHQALALLKKAGWKVTDRGLMKDGKPFEFTFVFPNQDFEKYATVIKEDMKKVGITMNLKTVEWNSFIKLIEERKFDAVALSWTANLEPDPKQIWHSDSIKNGGSNFASYSNPEVDRLITQLRGTMDAAKRIPIYHRIHELIARDQPYSFLFNRKYYLYAANARIHRPQDSFKYGLGVSTWSVKAEK